MTRARATGPEPIPAEAPKAPMPEIGLEELDVDSWAPPEVGFADDNDEAEAVMPPPSEVPADEADDETDIGFDDFTHEAALKEAGDQSSEPTDWASEMRQRLRVKIPVLILPMSGDETFGGVARVLSRTTLFVMVDEIRVYAGDRIVVRFPLSLGPLSVKIVFVCSVKRMARDRKSGSLGLDLVIDTVDEGKNQGIYKEFVTALRRRVDPL